ncbi:MAG: serine/threonine protein kinase [Calditrichaceae bacterium]|nr:protein kinase [Calditrichia bacterium]NUQ40021.1 serine/threonine protein kinase [Calditrichaceae bacterium]
MEQTDQMIGKTIAGRYEILQKLGEGGMGVVYKAMQTSVERIVALKILHPHMTGNEEALKRFQREAKTTSKLRQANAIHIYDFGVEGSLSFLVMEYIEGESLDDVIRKSGALELPRVANIVRQVCYALAEAHDLGIVHRDLKPSNIYLSRKRDGSEEVKVLDFGIAKVLGEQQGMTRLTQTGMIIGTPQYMSPEQVEGLPLDHRSDVYSLGIIMYELLTGETPFQADTPFKLLMKHVKEKPVPPRKFRPNIAIPEAVEKIVLKALEKDPAKRFQSISELQQSLEAAAGAPQTKTAKTGRLSKSLIPKTEVSIDKTAVATGIEKTEVYRGDGGGGGFKNLPGWVKIAAPALLILALLAVYFLFFATEYGELTVRVTPAGAYVEVYSPEVSPDDITPIPSAGAGRPQGGRLGFSIPAPQSYRIIPAQAALDEEFLDESSFAYRLPAGEYTVTASKDGYESAQQTAWIYKDEVTTLSIQLQPEKKPGELKISVAPEDAQVSVRQAGSAIPVYPTVGSGGQRTFPVTVGETYEISVSREGYAPVTETVTALILTFRSYTLNPSQTSIYDQLSFKTQVADRRTYEALLGDHLFSLQWISWDYFGKATVTEGQSGLLSIKGEQRERGGDGYLRIDGVIEKVESNGFIFNGKITTKVSGNNNGNPCVREGRYTFRSYEGRRYWRMQEGESPCDGVWDYVDVYMR